MRELRAACSSRIVAASSGPIRSGRLGTPAQASAARAPRLAELFHGHDLILLYAPAHELARSFQGSGLDVDVVPVLYAGDPEWRGNLVSQEDGSFLETSIPLHLEFTRKRKRKQETHFAQVVRLVKFWARRMKQEAARPPADTGPRKPTP